MKTKTKIVWMALCALLAVAPEGFAQFSNPIIALGPGNDKDYRVGLIRAGDGQGYFQGIVVFGRDGAGKLDPILIDSTSGVLAKISNSVTIASGSEVKITDGTDDVDVTTNGELEVSLTTALPAGTNAIGKLAANTGVDIGDVDVTSIAAGNNNIGDVDVASIAAGNNNIGDVDIATIAAGDNNIGNVDVLTIAAGDNNIGNVDIASALPAGTNAIGKLAANSGVDIGDVDVTSISAGDNNIGNMDVASIAAGDNNIGNVDVASSVTVLGGTQQTSGDNVANTLGARLSNTSGTAGQLETRPYVWEVGAGTWDAIPGDASAGVAVKTGSAQSGADGVSNTNITRSINTGVGATATADRTLPYLFNNSTWDREYSNTDLTILSSSARTATTNSTDQTNFNAKGVWVVLNISAVPGGDTVTLSITGKDPVSSTYVTLLTGAAQVGTGTTEYAVYPGVTETANTDVARPLPRTWRVTVTHSGSGSFTYSVGASVIR